MNDIQLRKTEEETYDWAFNDDDLVSASVYERTRNMVVHALMLRRNELQDLPFYEDKGSEVYSFVKAENNDEYQLLLEEEVRLTCNALEGVESTEVTAKHTRDGGWQMTITIIRTDGITVII